MRTEVYDPRCNRGKGCLVEPLASLISDLDEKFGAIDQANPQHPKLRRRLEKRKSDISDALCYLQGLIDERSCTRCTYRSAGRELL